MRMMAFYGKGGIGKSTVVSNLSVLFARNGLRVLQFGCDPKSDSCYGLVPGRIETVMDGWLDRGEAGLKLEHCLMQGEAGVECLEVGGPTPGTGCGGRGITKALELVGDPRQLRQRYDLVLFDVLGDVVCGGFSAPMREGYADEVYIVTSGEVRALYAANNISWAVKRYARSGVRLCGLIGNLRGVPAERETIERLAGSIGTRLLGSIPRDPAVLEAERLRTTCVQHAPGADASRAFAALRQTIEEIDPASLSSPRPLVRDEFDRLFAGRPASSG